MSDSKLAYRYTGKGDFHNGIPTRNLTEADVAALDKDDQKILAESPIYKAAHAADDHKAAKPKAAAPKDEAKAEPGEPPAPGAAKE
jgi:hypothetical protein